MIINDQAAVAWLEQQASAVLAVRQEIDDLSSQLRSMVLCPARKRAKLNERLDQLVNWWYDSARGVSCARYMIELVEDHPGFQCIQCIPTQERTA